MRRSLPQLILLQPLVVANMLLAQAPAKPTTGPTAKPVATRPSDVLTFANGDRLTGKLESVTAGNVIFDSDMAGKVTISIEKIKSLSSGGEFALLRKGVIVKKQAVPEGSIEVAGGNVKLTPTQGQAPAVVPASQVNYVIDRASFDKTIGQKPGIFRAWTGTLTGGASVERSTTSGTTINASAALVRAIPGVPWMDPTNRTLININESYGKLSTPIIPPTTPPSPVSVVVTSIFHAGFQRDEYVSPRLFVLGHISFDHNFGLGLELQQIYGVGIGYTAIKNSKEELDFNTDMQYEEQQYFSSISNGVISTTPSVNLIGSTLSEAYTRHLPHKVLFTETASVLPGWNILADYSANLTAALTMPVFKRLSATVSVDDGFLNDPAQYYQKNSFQFITGVTYVLP
ncbi:MAG: DUF481 domain-containing protein [Acidobacteriaceae bacterium]